MLPIPILIFIITQSFASELALQAHHRVLPENVDNEPVNIPVDHFDNIHLPQPDYKIRYIYEQKKIDELPQVEEIEEEIGKYMPHGELHQNIDHENKKIKETINHDALDSPIAVLKTDHHNHKDKEATSTLKPMPPAPELQEPINEVRPQIPTYYVGKWNYYEPAFPSKVPTPSDTLKWEELTEVPINDVSESHLAQPYNLMPNTHRHLNHRLHLSPTTSESPAKVEAQTNHVSTQKHIYLSPSTLIPQPMYRGSYKFNWDDINDLHTSIAPKVSLLKENSIPAVPTLSPWYDGYGK